MKPSILLLCLAIPHSVMAQGARVPVRDSADQRSKELRSAWASYEHISSDLEDAVANADPSEARKRIAGAKSALHTYSDRVVGSLDAALSDVDRELEFSDALSSQAQSVLVLKEQADISQRLVDLEKWIAKASSVEQGSDKKANSGVESAADRLRESLSKIAKIRAEQSNASGGSTEIVRAWLQFLERNHNSLESEKRSLSLSRSLQIHKRDLYDDYFQSLNDLADERERGRR